MHSAYLIDKKKQPQFYQLKILSLFLYKKHIFLRKLERIVLKFHKKGEVFMKLWQLLRTNALTHLFSQLKQQLPRRSLRRR